MTFELLKGGYPIIFAWKKERKEAVALPSFYSSASDYRDEDNYFSNGNIEFQK